MFTAENQGNIWFHWANQEIRKLILNLVWVVLWVLSQKQSRFLILSWRGVKCIWWLWHVKGISFCEKNISHQWGKSKSDCSIECDWWLWMSIMKWKNILCIFKKMKKLSSIINVSCVLLMFNIIFVGKEWTQMIIFFFQRDRSL